MRLYHPAVVIINLAGLWNIDGFVQGGFVDEVFDYAIKQLFSALKT
jgi:hypothetical protein